MNAVLMLSTCAKRQGGEDLTKDQLRFLGYVASPVNADDTQPRNGFSIGATDRGLEGVVDVEWGADEGIAW